MKPNLATDASNETFPHQYNDEYANEGRKGFWGKECSSGFSRMMSWNGSRSLAQIDRAGTDHILAILFSHKMNSYMTRIN